MAESKFSNIEKNSNNLESESDNPKVGEAIVIAGLMVTIGLIFIGVALSSGVAQPIMAAVGLVTITFLMSACSKAAKTKGMSKQ